MNQILVGILVITIIMRFNEIFKDLLIPLFLVGGAICFVLGVSYLIGCVLIGVPK